MYTTPLERRRMADISAAIERARAYATEQDVPLTAERLAAELDMALDMVHAIARGEYAAKSRSAAEKAEAIRRACGEATASVVEHAMRRGSGTNMHLLYLKNNAGYEQGKGQKETKEDKLPPVIFVGEEDIPE